MTLSQESFLNLGPDGFHRIAYRAWGDPGNDRVLICVHGLSRNARDFDPLASALQSDFRILALDMPGRGGSDWLADKLAYGLPLYAQVSAAAIALSGAAQVDWVGTSMGVDHPVARLVTADVAVGHA